MARSFTASGTNKVEWDIAAAAANLGPLTIWVWIKPSTLANGLGIFQSDLSNAAYRAFSVRSTGQIHYDQDMDATDLSVRSNTSNQITTGAWWFVAVTVETSGAELLGKLYIGSLTSPVQEVSGYTSQVNGNNNKLSDSGGKARWGNRNASSSLAFGGLIAIGGYENTNLTLAQLQSLQFHPRKLSTNVAFHDLGMGSPEPDLSGNGQNGTVTGATIGDHVPLGPLFGFDSEWMGAFASASGGTQTISGVGGIASAEAFGTSQLNRNLTASSIASAEAFGTPQLNRTIAPSGIASAESFGDPTLTPGDVAIAPTGISSTEAFGTAQLNQNVSPSSIASGEVFGTTKLNQTVVASSIASGEAFGSPRVNQTISPSSIATSEAFGTASLTAGSVTIVVNGIPSEEAFGDPVLSNGATIISLTAIASAEAFGNPVLQAGPVSIFPSGIASGESFGGPQVLPGSVTVAPSSIGSAETFGSPSLALTISLSGIPTGEAFGTASLLSVTGIYPSGIASQEAFGSIVVLGGLVSVVLNPTSIVLDSSGRLKVSLDSNGQTLAILTDSGRLKVDVN